MARPVFCGVYKIEHIDSGRVYVGSSINALKRLREHRVRLMDGRHPNPRLQNAWNKHGSAAFLFSLLEVVDGRDQLIEAEQRLIDLHRSFEAGFNQRPDVATQYGFRHSASARNKMRTSHAGKRLPKKTREAMKAAIASRPAHVTKALNERRAIKSREMHKIRTPDERLRISRKISETNRGKRVPKDRRLKISEALRGRRLTSAHVLAIRAAVGKLSDADRANIVRWKSEGDSYRVIASRLNVTHEAVRKAYKRETEA